MAMEPEGRYWIAYQAAVKDNVAIDTHQVEVPWDPNLHGPDVSTNVSRDLATPDLGIFMRHDGVAVSAVQVFNLRRRHDFRNPVFWLGRAEGDESLQFLERLLMDHPELGTGLVRAVGVHRGTTAAVILERSERLLALPPMAQAEALFWIGQTYGQASFLEMVATDTNASMRVRSAAVLSLLESPDVESQKRAALLRSVLKEDELRRLIDRYGQRRDTHE